MATICQNPLPIPVADMKQPMYHIDDVTDAPSPSTQLASFLSSPFNAIPKDDLRAAEVGLSQVVVQEDESQPFADDSSLTRDEALQMLVDATPDIEEAVARATEAAILEELEDLEPFPANVPHYEDNIVHMHTDAAYTLGSATYEIEETAIPEGQDPCNVCHVGSTLSYSGNQGSLDFLCGRAPSHNVAQWWADKISNSSSTTAPTALNFAFTGLLTLTVYGESLLEGADKIVLPDFGLAQGYSSTGALSWVFGSADGEADESQARDTVTCTGWSSAWGNLIQAHFRRPAKASDKIELVNIEYLC